MPPHQARHARPRPKRRRTLAALTLFPAVCSLPFLLQSSDPALANATRVNPTTTAHPDPHPRGPSSRRAADLTPAVLQQSDQLRTPALLQRWALQDRQDQRRVQAQLQADRAERRELARWGMPIIGAELGAPFGQVGTAWSSGVHTGQDFTAPYRTPVLAAGTGVITFAGWSGAYGKKIEITQPDGDETWYAHLSAFERTSGAVAPGDVIGYVGCTGNCFGNHLHFEVHPNGGDATDPIPWLDAHGVS